DALDLFSCEGTAKYHTRDEDEIRAILARYDNVIADPCFRPMVKGNFIPMPSVSVSGGIFRSQIDPLDTDTIASLLI
ncbi:MAG: hypothetical protein IJH98_01120, partial [Solobacterium sp.]|nr:hypothetical protein [Solobacterium sp.]